MSNLNNVCNSQQYLTSIELKKRFQLFNIPPQRYNNLENSPYINQSFNQYQLNMRRKAEILKYNANNSNTKTNNFTKSEKWGQLINGSSQKRNLSNSFIQKNLIPGTDNFINICPNGTIINTPTSSSDVPGPIINLFQDDNIPLYMYSTKTDVYGLINQNEDFSQFFFNKDLSNQYLNITNSIVLNSIFITNILTPIYTFNIQFPVSVFIYAEVKPNQIGSYIDTLTIDFSNSLPFQTTIYYGSNIIEKKNEINSPNLSLSSDIFSASFDISINLTRDIKITANQYIGQFFINNLSLNTQKGYIYDIYLNNISTLNIPSFKLKNINDNFNNIFQNISYGICINPTYDVLNNFQNCIIVNSSQFPSISNYQQLSII